MMAGGAMGRLKRYKIKAASGGMKRNESDNLEMWAELSYIEELA